MQKSSNKNTGNKISNIHEKTLVPELEVEKNETPEANENDKEVLETPFPQKSVKSILFVDDEEPVRKLFQEALEKFGYKVRVASNGDKGIKLFRENPADLIITDIFMPEKDGHVFILEIMQEFPETKIFAITGKKSFEPEMELSIAETLGAKRVFAKPCKISEILNAIKELSQKTQYPGRDIIGKNSGAVAESGKIASDNMTRPSKAGPNLEFVF